MMSSSSESHRLEECVCWGKWSGGVKAGEEASGLGLVERCGFRKSEILERQ